MKLGFYGCGHMGGAILKNVLSQKLCGKDDVLVVNRSAEKARQIQETFGVKTSHQAHDLRHCKTIVLAIKPQNLGEIEALEAPGATVVSILAGTRIAQLRQVFPASKIVRTMPNLPIQDGSGMTALCFDEAVSFSEEERAFVVSLFQTGGRVLELSEERINRFTAFCGSGPAYFLYLAQTMRDEAIAQGFSPQEADTMLRQELIGAADMAANASASLEELRGHITSKQGVTEAGIQTLENSDFPAMLSASLRKAIKRAEELGN